MNETNLTETKSQKSLLEEMKAATQKNDWKSVSKISSEIAKLVATQEKLERDKKLEAVVGLTDKVKTAIDKVIVPMIDAKELDVCDGVWYSRDFGSTEVTCKLIKGGRNQSGGGGAGKKFSITTKELLEKYGDEVLTSGDHQGKTFNQVFKDEEDGNLRYTMRVKLLKMDGLC